VISEREVSPKFVFGKKKYGRRSRPESTDQDLTVEHAENSEDSDLEIFVPIEDRTKEITVVCMTSHPYIMEINVAYRAVEPCNIYHHLFHVLQRSVNDASSLEDDEHIKKWKTGVQIPLDRKGTSLAGTQNSGNAVVYLCLALFWYHLSIDIIGKVTVVDIGKMSMI
jgi:hypothetical protein